MFSHDSYKSHIMRKPDFCLCENKGAVQLRSNCETDQYLCFHYTIGINRIHHGWSVEIEKSQPEGPSVPVGNEARRVSHWNDGPEG